MSFGTRYITFGPQEDGSYLPSPSIITVVCSFPHPLIPSTSGWSGLPMITTASPAALCSATMRWIFLHKGTGGIHHSHIPLLQDLINMPADAVGADNDRSLVSWKGPQLLLCLQDHDPLIRQIPDHFLVVDNGTVGVDGAGCLLFFRASICS